MMRRTLHAALLATLAAASSASPVRGQDPLLPDAASEGLVERVVAIVGDSIVTLTQLQQYMIVLQAQGQTIPEDSAALAALRAEAVQALVNQQLILQAAARDSTLVPDAEEIEGRVAEAMDQTIQRFGTAQQFETALSAQGLTRAEYRDQITQRLRREQIQQLFMASRLREATPVAVSETELRSVFDSLQASLGTRPEILTLRQAALRSGATDSAWAAARREIDSLLVRVRSGEDFAAVATEATDDPSGVETGGDLGWFRRGQMVQEFEEVAFRLPDGMVSDPVRTQYGWHVIKVERSRPGEVKARHILVRPEVGEGASERARTLADSLAAMVRAGSPLAGMLPAFAEHLNEQIPDSLAVPRTQIDQAVPDAWRQPLRQAAEGDVLGPFPFQAGEELNYVVVEVVDVRPAGPYTFEDMRARLEAQLRQQRQIERIFASLRDRTYVDVRL